MFGSWFLVFTPQGFFPQTFRLAVALNLLFWLYEKEHSSSCTINRAEWNGLRRVQRQFEHHADSPREHQRSCNALH